MLSFKAHAKKFDLDDEEQEILADFEANHAGKPQITEERKRNSRRWLMPPTRHQ